MIEIPHPPKALSPNARVHWAAKAKAAKSYKNDCFWLAKAVPFTDPGGEIPIRIQWHPKSSHAFDEDNAIASLKAALDGIALAWGVNDSRFKLMPLEKMSPVKGGKVLIHAVL